MRVSIGPAGGGWRAALLILLVLGLLVNAVFGAPALAAGDVPPPSAIAGDALQHADHLGLARVPLSAASAASSASAGAPPRPAEPPRWGVNLAGAEFGVPNNWMPPGGPSLPGTYGVHYVYPPAEALDYYRGKGLSLVRLPFRWERLQPKLFGPLDPAELGRLDAFVAAARARGMQVILDPHNYARYYDRLIGTPEVPNEAFADFWRRLAGHYRNELAVWAYGLMNEPAETGGRWPAAAQAAVDAIRSVDTTHRILVPGDGWSSGQRWPQNNPRLDIRDPADNVMYEAHQYFDPDHSGRYAAGYDASGGYPELGVDLIRPFVEWLAARGARGFIGEFGVPGDDPRWLEVLDRFMAYLAENGIGGTYWAGGPWWGSYPLSVEPADGRDRPQIAVLERYARGAPVACRFVQGFATLHDLIPDVVGECLENEWHNPENGDALQRTTGGLLVWRKADNWTAFTDGDRTWVNGPNGLEQRRNTERFPWEATGS